MVLAAGSVAGAESSFGTSELERRILYEAMRRLYDYERDGRITSVERDRLLAKYRRQLDRMNANAALGSSLVDGTNINLFRKDLIALLDQRMAQISSKLDDLRSSIESGTPARSEASSNTEVERKEEKQQKAKMTTTTPEEEKRKTDGQASQSRSEPLPAADSTDNVENDSSLEDIKKEIMQTLSRLEQAEVE